MAEETKQNPTYRLGDTIRLELDVSDPSGVTEVWARFALANDATRKIDLHANAQGATDTTVDLQREVTEVLAPGEYECQFVSLTDRLDNQTIISRPAIRFRVEGVPGDHEGPELRDWRMAHLSAEEQRQRVMEIVRRETGEDCPELVVESAEAILGGGLVRYRCKEGDRSDSLRLTPEDAGYVGIDMSVRDRPDDPQQCMLMEFDKLLEDGPFDVRNEQITSIGADCGLTEEQSYRSFRRLLRDGKIIGDLITISEPPGFAGAWIEDVRLY